MCSEEWGGGGGRQNICIVGEGLVYLCLWGEYGKMKMS